MHCNVPNGSRFVNESKSINIQYKNIYSARHFSLNSPLQKKTHRLQTPTHPTSFSSSSSSSSSLNPKTPCPVSSFRCEWRYLDILVACRDRILSQETSQIMTEVSNDPHFASLDLKSPAYYQVMVTGGREGESGGQIPDDETKNWSEYLIIFRAELNHDTCRFAL